MPGSPKGSRDALIVMLACLLSVAVAGCVSFAFRAAEGHPVAQYRAISFDVPVSDRSFNEMAVFDSDSEVSR